MSKMKNKYKYEPYLLSSTLVIFITIFTWLITTDIPTKCGKVEEINYRTLVVLFDDGKYEEITTDFDTAYRATKGQRSCFEKETTSSKVYLIVVVLLGSLNFLVLLELLISKFNEQRDE